MKIPYLKITLAAIGFTLAATHFAQTSFQATYGGSSNDRLIDMLHTSDGGLLLVGETYSYGEGIDDYYIIKTDANGEEEWNTVIGGDIAEFATSAVETSDGGFVIVGSTYSWVDPMSENVFITKINSTGEIVWAKAVGAGDSERGYMIKNTADGGFIIGGLSDSYSAGGYDFYILKINSEGVSEWANTIGFNSNDVCRGIFQTELGDYIAVGQSAGGFMVCRINEDGEHNWTKRYAVDNTNMDLFSAVESADGNYVLTGWEHLLTDVNQHNMLGVKIDSAGNVLWSKSYGSYDDMDFSNAVTEIASGGFVFVGSTKSFAVGGDQDFFVVKSDNDGDLVWAKTYGYLGYESANCVLENEDGTIAIGGTEDSNGAGELDMWLIQISESGYVGCVDDTDPDAIVISEPSITVVDLDVVVTEESPSDGIFWNSLPLSPPNTSGGTFQILCTDMTLDVIENHSHTGLDIYPNPSTGSINIAFNNVINVRLFDLQGRAINYTMDKNVNSMQLTTNYKGMALVTIQTNSEVITKTVTFY